MEDAVESFAAGGAAGFHGMSRKRKIMYILVAGA